MEWVECICLCLGISAGIAGFGISPDSAGRVVMFWNVENFFDSADDPSVADDDFTAFGKMRWGRKRFDKKRNAIAKTIISVADRYGTFPVVVGLAEVENYGVLWRLVNLTPLSKLGYGIIHMDSRDRRGIDVAMLYRKENFKPLCVDFVEVEMPDTTRHTRLILCCKGVFSDRCEDTVQFIVVHFRRNTEERGPRVLDA